MKVFNGKAVVGAFSYTLVLRIDLGYIRLEILDNNNTKNTTTIACSNINSIEELEDFITNHEQIKKIIEVCTVWVDLDILDFVPVRSILEKMQKIYEESLLESKMRFLKTYPDPETRSNEVIKLLDRLEQVT